MKKFIALLSAFLVCTSICGCEAKNADSTVETTETTITETTTLESTTTMEITTTTVEESQILNTALELKTATFMIPNELNVVDLSNENESGNFDYLNDFNYVLNINNDFFVAIEEYTIYGDNSSSDDILLNEYVQRNKPDTIDTSFKEIGNKNCAVLIYNDGRDGHESEIIYLFVENGIHYRFYATFNSNVDNSIVNKAVEDVISTFEQHIDNANVLDEIAVSLDNEIELDETASVQEATFSIPSSWRQEIKENGEYNWYASDLSFFSSKSYRM